MITHTGMYLYYSTLYSPAAGHGRRVLPAAGDGREGLALAQLGRLRDLAFFVVYVWLCVFIGYVLYS